MGVVVHPTVTPILEHFTAASLVSFPERRHLEGNTSTVLVDLQHMQQLEWRWPSQTLPKIAYC